MAATQARKKARLRGTEDTDDKVYLLEGEHIPEDEVATSRWKRIVEIGSQWTDDAFPPDKRSLEGEEPSSATAHAAPSAPPRVVNCRCNVPCARATVKKDTPNKGREYFCCSSRTCGFFAWTDNRRAQWPAFAWKRFPHFVVVTDAGFCAADLRQGGVGDCWFLSALAVVAERHDLIAKLFADTAPNCAGCYHVRLFLDGDWRSILVDDLFPVTDKPRRPEHAADTGLAFSRSRRNQLWAPLLEKAYAKAHGSYRAIVGGEVAEALLDLTGAPVFTVEMDHPGFTLDALWAQLVYFKSQKFPMGCATSPDPFLAEMGLVGNHAYSLLECREVKLKEGRRLGGAGSSAAGSGHTGQQGGSYVRLLRIRNPHGVGEWSGEWSDASSNWATLLSSSGLERTGVDDGTFWMDLTHFVMGFSIVDVCFAFPDWHTRSLPNAFCAPTSPWRVCQHVCRVRATQPTLLYLMGLQPTKRGAWCRADRKKSYKLGDLSLLVARLDSQGNIAQVVGGGLHGSASQSRCSFVATLDDPASDYLVIPFNLGAGPSAAEVTKGQPFTVRYFSSAPLVITEQRFQERCGDDTCRALAAFHRGLVYLLQCEQERRQQQAVVGRCSYLDAGACAGTRHASGVDPLAIIRPRVRWHWRPLSSSTASITAVAKAGPSSGGEEAAGGPVVLVDIHTEGVVVCLVINRGPHTVHVEVTADVKVMLARGSTGSVLKPDASARNELNPRPPAGIAVPVPPPLPGGFKWVAKWKRFRHTAACPGTKDASAHDDSGCASGAAGNLGHMPGGWSTSSSSSAGHQRLVMMLVAKGAQSELGALSARIVEDEMQGATAAVPEPSGPPPGKRQTTLNGWLRVPGGGAAAGTASARSEGSSPQHGLFSPVPLLDDLALLLAHSDDGLRRSARPVSDVAASSLHDAAALREEEAALAAALAASMRDHAGVRGGTYDDVALMAALSASLEGHPSDSKAHLDVACDEDAQLALALAESAREARWWAERDVGTTAGTKGPSPFPPGDPKISREVINLDDDGDDDHHIGAKKSQSMPVITGRVGTENVSPTTCAPSAEGKGKQTPSDAIAPQPRIAPVLNSGSAGGHPEASTSTAPMSQEQLRAARLRHFGQIGSKQ
eukprot:jgi/Mesvir1/17849/Mv12933-RA.1